MCYVWSVDLAHLLETTESKAQVIAAKMITTKVISASVDQVKGVLRFAEAGGGLGELRADWEAGVRGFCEGLNEAADGARAAMEAAFASAERVTLTGSITPSAIRSP